jgi:hypothetical protein
MAVLLTLAACRQGVPVVDLGPKPPAAHGTIAGLVLGSGNTGLPNRTVEVVNVATGERHTAVTAENGGFSIELPHGKYRVSVELRPGESLTRKPGIVDLDRGDIDSHVEFAVSTTRGARRPSYPIDNGLGAPMA